MPYNRIRVDMLPPRGCCSSGTRHASAWRAPRRGTGRHVAPRDDPDANFAYVRFADAASARRALRRNGRRAGGRMVGVAPLDARSRAKLRDMYGDEGLARREPREGDPSFSRQTRQTPGGSGPRRIVRARAGGAAAPSSRPHCWRPTRDGVALQPRRAFWDKVTEFVFGC